MDNAPDRIWAWVGFDAETGSNTLHLWNSKPPLNFPEAVTEYIRAALDAAEADKARAVEAERDRCIAAACGALDKRKASYMAKHERALTMGSEDAALYEHLATSQDWASTAVVAAIYARGAKP